MNSFKAWVTTFLLVLVLVPAAASATGIEAAAGVWNQRPNGDFSYKPVSALDDLNVRNDLNYNDRLRVSGRIKIETPLFFPNVYLMATPMNFSGTGSKNATFQFGDTTFNGNVPFNSQLRLDHYDLALYYAIPGLKKATGSHLNVEIGVDARLFDLKASVTGTDGGGSVMTQSKTLVAPVPLLYVGFQVKPVKWFALEGEARGVTYGANHYYDIVGRAKFKPYGPIFAASGYRYEKLDMDIDDIKAHVSFGGPFGEVGVEF